MAFNYELLPPIVPDILPAFSEDKIKFYFTVGDGIGQTLDKIDINTVQYSIVNQETGEPIQFKNEINNEILNYGFYQGANIQPCMSTYDIQFGDHYIEINTNNFTKNVFYKIQMRFSKKTINNFLQDISQIQTTDFSEWSSICLIKKIDAPDLLLTYPNLNSQQKNQIIDIPNIPFAIQGSLISNTEKLKKYKIKITNIENNIIFLNTDFLAPSTQSQNTFSYIFRKKLKQGIQYKIDITFTTQSGYERTDSWIIRSLSKGESNNPATISVDSLPETGKMLIYIIIPSEEHYEGNFVIRRASADSKFTEWDDIKIIQFISNGNTKNVITQSINDIFYDIYILEDKTIKSGMYYKYGVAPLRKGGWRGTFKSTPTSYTCIFDDMFLMGDNKQLRIRFDPSISNFKYNVTENVQTTLGAKYPYINRNGNNYYRSFSIGGLITTYMDTNNFA